MKTKFECQFNPGQVDSIEPLIFTRDQLIDYFAEQEITMGQPFTAPPIDVIDDCQFTEMYRAADVFQSGLVYYVPRN
jgi:hypothetical protein